jgi:hypothetical protein
MAGQRHGVPETQPEWSGMIARMSEKITALHSALSSGNGIVRLAPCWVPRSFLMPGGRLKLHPNDLYALGAHRGGIDERWFSSTTQASNGPGTPEDEGLAYIVAANGSNGDTQKILLKEAIAEIGDEFLGQGVMSEYGGWNVLCKFFDNLGPIPHHMHQGDEAAARVGQKGKPEAYYFPPQFNYKENNFAYTFMGLEPGTTKDDVRRCLERWNEGDNGILYHSKAYKLKPGSGWHIPAGVLHAPGSAVTYEPQVNSDVFGMFQSMVEGRAVPWDLLVKDVPEEFHHDLDYIIGMLDWEANVDPHFMQNRYFEPTPVKAVDEMEAAGYSEQWITYSTDFYSAKELTVLPGRTATITDAAAHGMILTQGRGKVGAWEVHTPAMIRYGELTSDEFFVTAAAAQAGVEITNTSSEEKLVMLKHFGPGNPDAKHLIR